jgi:uncharacterized RDD family membrane protein YckC
MFWVELLHLMVTIWSWTMGFFPTIPTEADGWQPIFNMMRIADKVVDLKFVFATCVAFVTIMNTVLLAKIANSIVWAALGRGKPKSS